MESTLAVPAARIGEPVAVLDRRIEFSFWPVKRGKRRNQLQSKLFASNPWSILNQISYKVPSNYRSQATFYLRQSEQLYYAAQRSPSLEAKPLLSYYCILNAAKFGCILKHIETDFSNSSHGLSTPTTPTGKGFIGGELEFWKSRHNGSQTVNVFDCFNQITNQRHLTHRSKIDINQISKQVLLGHRLWCEAMDQKESFVSVSKFEMLQDQASKIAWINIYINRNDMKRIGFSIRNTLQNTEMSNEFKQVKSDQKDELCFEATNPTTYTGRTSDILNEVTGKSTRFLWQSATTTPPFRKYYLFANKDSDIVYSQLSSVYIFYYYLSSLTRYYPDSFTKIIDAPIGAFVREFLENQLPQFFYLFASHLKNQDIARAAVVSD